MIENSQPLLYFVCHCPGIAAPEGGIIDVDCDKGIMLCAELDVRVVEDTSPESTNLWCHFLNPHGNFQLLSWRLLLS